MTSHIPPECALNPNAPTFVGQSANNYVLYSSPGLQTSKDMITNTVSELNISNDYFTANIEELEYDTHPTVSVSPPPKLNETDTKSMTSNLTETESDDSDDEIPDRKHCDICNLELKSVNHIMCTVFEKLMQKTSLDFEKCKSLFDTLD